MKQLLYRRLLQPLIVLLTVGVMNNGYAKDRSHDADYFRAPRLDAPAFDSPIEPVPPTGGCCDNSEVLRSIAVLRACCANLTATVIADFNGTFTAIAAISCTGSGSGADCCNGTFTMLSRIENDIQGTFTAIAAITAGTDCCNGTFTMLTDILNTITTLNCCNGTFTALADIKNTIVIDFNGTWTALTDIKDTITTLNCCNGTFTAIAELRSTMITDFNGTWTILAALAGAECPPTIIHPADFVPNGYTILNPGTYQLCGSVGFAGLVTNTQILDVAASNVILDLNGYTLYQSADSGGTLDGIRVQDRHNVVIKNGTVSNVNNTGIVITGSCNNIMIENIASNRNLSTGILIQDVVFTQSVITIKTSSFVENALFGGFFSFTDSVDISNSIFNSNKFSGISSQNCQDWNIDSCQFNNNRISGASITTCTNFSFSNSQMNGNKEVGTSSTCYGLLADTAFLLAFDNCQFNSNVNTGIDGTAYGLSAQNRCQEWHLTNCTFNGNEATNGFEGVGALIRNDPQALRGFAFENCTFNNNKSNDSGGLLTGLGIGLRLQASGCSMKNCQFFNNVCSGGAASSLAAGLSVEPNLTFTSGNNLCINSIAQANTGGSANVSAKGFNVAANGAECHFFSCDAVNNINLFGGPAVGFDFAATTTAMVIQNCQAYANNGTGSFGFRDANAVLSNWYIGNKSFGHGVNNYSSIIGFVGIGIGAQPGAGSFDERGIDNISAA
jgi:hypothetical protein